MKTADTTQLATAVANPPTKREQPKYISLLHSSKEQFTRALGKTIDSDRFMRIILTEVRNSPALEEIAQRNPLSLIAACMEIAQLGLDPSIPNEVFLVPYKTEIQAQCGYKGLQKLAIEAAYQSGQALVVCAADMICQNDIYERSFGSDRRVIHQPPPFGEDRGAPIGYVAVSKSISGKIDYVEMTVEEVRAHKARFSKATRGPNADERNFDRYGCKTVLRLLIMRHLPMSARLSRAIGRDIEIETEEPNRLTQVEILEQPIVPTPELGTKEGSDEITAEEFNIG